jgi:hypothetical protein
MSPATVSYRDVVRVINQILAVNGIQRSITGSDITITDRTVSDGVTPEQALSNAIVEHLWPHVPEAEVFHYTTSEAAESIFASNTLRLTNIAKRYNEGEVRTFCESHRLNGYLGADAKGEPQYRHLIMPNTYYASFTTTSLDEDEQRYFWQNFAPDGGVRLRLRVIASNPDFRRIRYEAKRGKPIPLLAELSAQLRSEFGREFVLSGISRLCSFYLSGADYGREQECRMLYRTWDRSGPQAVGSGPASFVELRLGAMSECGYEIHALEVCSDSRPEMPDDVVFVRREN